MFLNFQVYLDESNGIRSQECDCPRGAFICSHAACIFVHAIYNVSRTDVECSWKKGKKTELSKQSISEMFQPTKPDYEPLTREPNATDRAELYAQLQQYGRFTGLCWLMSPEPTPQQEIPIPTIEQLIFSEEFLALPTDEQQLQFIKWRVAVNSETTTKISMMTLGQRTNPTWHLVRKGRLTASNFGVVLMAKRTTPSLIKRLLGEYDISRVKAIAWGVNNEPEAIKSFEVQTNLKVEETGVWLHESGVLGASPDGLVGSDHVLEGKCPFTQRNMTLEEALGHKNFCLEKIGDRYHLKKSHVYWHQVQGQIYITKRKACFFVVWTPRWCVVIEILKDPEWAANLDELTQFYFNHIFAKIVEGEL